ncbi:DUF6249 domain-containing protein [Frateuria hangzhouensis]|uniref:DUF6249 domain-containing protein n=1 Tax=Frateuria hangzhouensis TaxID=2995589 RepID=UPI002260F328|nr:DUF6249 domain-containing protein [Frateuria sp. STR12]MCX7515326.1 DUF6249 domain-containing protein [Frateuria sp. STR12]
MNFEIFIPITLFICIAYAIKAVVDARVRRQMVAVGGSEELVRSVLQGDELRRRHASLHWGVVLVALGIGLGLIQMFGWQELTPGLVAVLAIATGLGNLVFYGIARKIG